MWHSCNLTFSDGFSVTLINFGEERISLSLVNCKFSVRWWFYFSWIAVPLANKGEASRLSTLAKRGLASLLSTVNLQYASESIFCCITVPLANKGDASASRLSTESNQQFSRKVHSQQELTFGEQGRCLSFTLIDWATLASVTKLVQEEMDWPLAKRGFAAASPTKEI